VSSLFCSTCAQIEGHKLPVKRQPKGIVHNRVELPLGHAGGRQIRKLHPNKSTRPVTSFNKLNGGDRILAVHYGHKLASNSGIHKPVQFSNLLLQFLNLVPKLTHLVN